MHVDASSQASPLVGKGNAAVFAIRISVLRLGEPFTRTRLIAILMSAAAVPLLRLA